MEYFEYYDVLEDVTYKVTITDLMFKNPNINLRCLNDKFVNSIFIYDKGVKVGIVKKC